MLPWVSGVRCSVQSTCASLSNFKNPYLLSGFFLNNHPFSFCAMYTFLCSLGVCVWLYACYSLYRFLLLSISKVVVEFFLVKVSQKTSCFVLFLVVFFCCNCFVVLFIFFTPRERQYSSWSAALSSYSFRAVPRNSTTSVDQIIEGSQAVGYPEDAFFKSCALRAKKLPFQTRSFLQLQITQLFVNAENPELPPIPITPLPSHQHFRDSSTVASDIPLQQRPAEGQHALISCASDQPHNEEEGKHQATDIMNTAIAEIYNWNMLAFIRDTFFSFLLGSQEAKSCNSLQKKAFKFQW